MAGMASTDDISKLAGLTGRDAEVWFLQLMIRHHRGGLLMAKAAYNSDDVSDIVKRTAYEMMTDQGEGDLIDDDAADGSRCPGSACLM